VPDRRPPPLPPRKREGGQLLSDCNPFSVCVSVDDDDACGDPRLTITVLVVADWPLPVDNGGSLKSTEIFIPLYVYLGGYS